MLLKKNIIFLSLLFVLVINLKASFYSLAAWDSSKEDIINIYGEPDDIGTWNYSSTDYYVLIYKVKLFEYRFCFLSNKLVMGYIELNETFDSNLDGYDIYAYVNSYKSLKSEISFWYGNPTYFWEDYYYLKTNWYCEVNGSVELIGNLFNDDNRLHIYLIFRK